MNLPELKTLQQVRDEYTKRERLPIPIPEYLKTFEPSELNRLFTMISLSDGSVNHQYFRELQSYMNSFPPRPHLRMQNISTTIRETLPPSLNSSNKNRLPRSRLIDQFYSHQLPGIEDESLKRIRELIKKQQILRDSAINGEELLKLSSKKLMDAFPDVSPLGTGLLPTSHTLYQDDESNKESTSKVPKCPLRYMESSIAVVLEHTEHLSIDIQRQDFEEKSE